VRRYASTRGCGGRRTGRPVKIEVKGLVVKSYSQSFRIQIKTARIKFLISRFAQSNPFTELSVYVVNAKTWLAVQIEITTEFDILGTIFLLMRALRNIAGTKAPIFRDNDRSLSIGRSRKWSSQYGTLPKHQSDERA
jgi:hypothetical protein